MSERKDRPAAKLLSAVRPSAEQEKRFLAFLETQYSPGTTLTWQQSDAYPNGFRLEVGAEVYDWSVEGRLDQFKSALEKLAAAQRELAEEGYSLLIWDAYRPVSAQYRLWEVCPNPVYVADPTKGFSKHSRGNTVDISLIRTNGDPVEMPSGFDDFTSRADRDYSDVSQAAGENASYLEAVMTDAGFVGYSGEWWHYSDSTEYPVVDAN